MEQLRMIISAVIAVFIVYLFILTISLFVKEVNQRHITGNLVALFDEKFKLRDDYKLTIVKGPYDIKIEVNNLTYLIKVLTNLENKNLVVTKDFHWVIKDDMYDESIKSLNLMNFLSINQDNVNPSVIKAIIIYPSIKQKIYMIDECQMRFIYPTTLVCDCHVLTFNELKEYIKEEYGD